MSLYDELTTGPLAAEIAPHIASGNDGAIVEIMNRRDIPAYGWISCDDLMTWFAANKDEYINAETIAANTAHPLYAAAKMLLERSKLNATNQALNLGAPEIYALVNNWPFVDQTGAAKAALLSKGQKLISRAEQLGISVDTQAVAQALRG